jgi:hypothetical protein
MKNGYWQRMLRIDLANRKTRVEDIPEKRPLAGSDQAMLLRFMGYHSQNASFEALNCHFHLPK